MSPRKRRSTFVGTCYYLSPELLEFNICEPPSDLWALGCIIYQLYYLEPPFKSTTEYQVFEKIKNVELSFPKNDVITDEAIDLIKKLLVKIPEDRLGAGERPGLHYTDLKSHPYFQKINFDTLFEQKVPEIREELNNKEEHLAKLDKIKKEIESEHTDLINNQSSIVLCGLIEKKSFASYFPVYYILRKGFQVTKLTNYQSDAQKITLSPVKDDLVALKIDNETFTIIADECTLSVRTPDTDKWVEALNS